MKEILAALGLILFGAVSLAVDTACNCLISIGILFAMMWLIPSLSVAIAAYPVVTAIIPLITLAPISILPALFTENPALTATISIIVPIVINAIIFTAAVYFGAPAFIPHWFTLSATHITFASSPLLAKLAFLLPYFGTKKEETMSQSRKQENPERPNSFIHAHAKRYNEHTYMRHIDMTAEEGCRL